MKFTVVDRDECPNPGSPSDVQARKQTKNAVADLDRAQDFIYDALPKFPATMKISTAVDVCAEHGIDRAYGHQAIKALQELGVIELTPGYEIARVFK